MPIQRELGDLVARYYGASILERTSVGHSQALARIAAVVQEVKPFDSVFEGLVTELAKMPGSQEYHIACMALDELRGWCARAKAE